MTVLQLMLMATVVSFVVITAIQRVPRKAWPLALRIGLATLFAATGISHFVGLRADLIAMVPPVLPNPGLLVTITGVLELAGAIGLLVRPTAAWAAGGLGLLLIAMFPANVYAASAGIMLAGEPASALLPRTLEQALYLAYAVAIVATTRADAVRPKRLISGSTNRLRRRDRERASVGDRTS